MNKYTCPECKGEGVLYKNTIIERGTFNNVLHYDMECYFCEGTGFATDEASFEAFYDRGYK